MLDANLHGRVAHKSKSINVEANLLSQRNTEREKVRAAARRHMLLLGITAVVLAAGLPPVLRYKSGAARTYALLKKQETEVNGRIVAYQKAQDSAKPELQGAQVTAGARKYDQEFLGQVTLLLNAVTPNMTLTFFRANVDTSGFSINIQADATSFDAASDFISLAGKGPNVIDTQVSSERANPAVGPNGVTISLVKKLKV